MEMQSESPLFFCNAFSTAMNAKDQLLPIYLELSHNLRFFLASMKSRWYGSARSIRVNLLSLLIFNYPKYRPYPGCLVVGARLNHDLESSSTLPISIGATQLVQYVLRRVELHLV